MKDGAYRYGDVTVIKDGDSVRFYDHNTGNLTRDMTVKEANEALRSERKKALPDDTEASPEAKAKTETKIREIEAWARENVTGLTAEPLTRTNPANTHVSGDGKRYAFRDSSTGMANDALLPYDAELAGFIQQRGDYIVDGFDKLVEVVNLAFDAPQKRQPYISESLRRKSFPISPRVFLVCQMILKEDYSKRGEHILLPPPWTAFVIS